MGKTIVDVSVEIYSGMVTYPNDPEVEVTKMSDIRDRASSNVSRISCSAHIGTHLDSPYHYYESGKSVDEAEPELLIGPCYVCDMDQKDVITKADLMQFPLGNFKRLLFKTRNSEIWGSGTNEFIEDYVYLSGDGAEYLVEQGIRLVGIDYLSIDSFHDKKSPAHKALLGNGVFIIEGLDFRGVSQGEYELICAPLKIRKSDGAPARVFLREI